MSGRVPPSSQASKLRRSRTEIQKAANRYRRFTGHEAEELGSFDIPPLPKVVSCIGDVDFIGYTTIRDGKEQSFIHKFNKKDKPLFCVTPDGKQILFVKGNYTFTERGIVDRSDRKK